MKVAIIGGGNMGASIAAGIISKGIVKGDEVIVSHLKKGMSLPDSVRLTRDNIQAATGAEIIITAVKPWSMQQVLTEIAPVIDTRRQTVVSVAAGVKFSDMTEWLPAPAPALFRVVPNTAVAVGKSVTFIAQKGADEISMHRVSSIFEALGSVHKIQERQIEAATALASCGIAYALKYIQAATEGGVQMGMGQGEALEIVTETMAGALALLGKRGLTPKQEIDMVTTPGGITMRGLDAMEQGGFTQAVIAGLKASK